MCLDYYVNLIRNKVMCLNVIGHLDNSPDKGEEMDCKPNRCGFAIAKSRQWGIISYFAIFSNFKQFLVLRCDIPPSLLLNTSLLSQPVHYLRIPTRRILHPERQHPPLTIIFTGAFAEKGKLSNHHPNNLNKMAPSKKTVSHDAGGGN
jgi:hypothetical protein